MYGPEQKLHDFDEKRAEGERHERDLDAYFSRYYAITQASRTAQENGIDRHFSCKVSGTHMSVEYKADSVAARTGNAFISSRGRCAPQKGAGVYPGLPRRAEGTGTADKR